MPFRSSPQSRSSEGVPRCTDDGFDRPDLDFGAGVHDEDQTVHRSRDASGETNLPLGATDAYMDEDEANDEEDGANEGAPKSRRRPNTDSRCLPRLRHAPAPRNRVRCRSSCGGPIGVAFRREPCAPRLHGFSGNTAASAKGSSSIPGPSKSWVPPRKTGQRKAAAKCRTVETKWGDEDELPVISEPHEMFLDMVLSFSCR